VWEQALAALGSEKRQQITELLRAMPPGKAALLARAITAMRASGGGTLPTDFILDALSPALQTARPDRSSLRRMICMPFEPFLTDDAQRDDAVGLIQRTTLMPWWDALTAVAGPEIAALEAEVERSLGADSELDALAVRARAAAAGWTASVLTVAADAAVAPSVRALAKNPGSRIMLKQAFEILKEAEPLTAAIAAVMAAAGRDAVLVGGRLIDLTNDVVNVAKQHYGILAARENITVTRYFALAILNRLEKPWLIFRFTRALALQRDATIVANTEFGGIGERLLADLERAAAMVDAANPKGRMSAHLADFDRLRGLVGRYIDCAEGVLNEIDLRRDSAWGETMLRSRARMREALEEDRLQPAEDAIRAVLAERLPAGPNARRPGSGAAPPDPAAVLARAEQAIQLLTFIAQRASRQGFASPARKSLDRLVVEIDKCCEDLIADLRLDPTDADARRLIAPAIALVAPLFPRERAEILTRRLNNELGAPA
jgi:hypothetical protein